MVALGHGAEDIDLVRNEPIIVYASYTHIAYTHKTTYFRNAMDNHERRLLESSCHPMIAMICY